eukprot:8192655-Alexandrium_andersonii.AAC.1
MLHGVIAAGIHVSWCGLGCLRRGRWGGSGCSGRGGGLGLGGACGHFLLYRSGGRLCGGRA